MIASFSSHERFASPLRHFGIPTVSDSSKDLRFDDELFPMASSMDPTYAFHELNDYLGTKQKYRTSTG